MDTPKFSNPSCRCTSTYATNSAGHTVSLIAVIVLLFIITFIVIRECY
jgi:hypothetical protein